MKTHVVKIDRSRSLAQEPTTGHNRWHEAIPPIARVEPGDHVVMETRDAFDGQVPAGSNAETVRHADLGEALADGFCYSQAVCDACAYCYADAGGDGYPGGGGGGYY